MSAQNARSRLLGNRQRASNVWRRHPDSNRGWRFCRPLPYHLAMAPIIGCIGQRREGRRQNGDSGLWHPAVCPFWSGRRDSNPRPPPWQGGTLPLSHSRVWCLRSESNQRHEDFQSSALPTELQRRIDPGKPMPESWICQAATSGDPERARTVDL